MGLTLSRPLKCLLTAVALMLPPDLVIKALISSLVTSPEALGPVGSSLMAGEGVGSVLMGSAAVSSDLIEDSCAYSIFRLSVKDRREEAIVMYIDMILIANTSGWFLHTEDVCNR